MSRSFGSKLLAVLLACCVSYVVADVGENSKEKPVEIRLVHGTQNEQLNDWLRFENCAFERVEIHGDILRGKYYQLVVKEFRDGKVFKTETLFDGTEAEAFQIKGNKLSFRLIGKTQDNQLRLQIFTPQFSSRQLKSELLPSKMDYVLKDFVGSQPSLHVSADKPFYLYSIIPPTMRADGSGSYCEVAQSDVPPESLGTKFNLAQYFLIEMQFLDAVVNH